MNLSYLSRESLSVSVSIFSVCQLLPPLHTNNFYGKPTFQVSMGLSQTICTTYEYLVQTLDAHMAFLEVCELMALYLSSQQATLQPTEKPFSKKTGLKSSCLVWDIAIAEENSWHLAEDCTQSK